MLPDSSKLSLPQNLTLRTNPCHMDSMCFFHCPPLKGSFPNDDSSPGLVTDYLECIPGECVAFSNQHPFLPPQEVPFFIYPLNVEFSPCQTKVQVGVENYDATRAVGCYRWALIKHVGRRTDSKRNGIGAACGYESGNY